VREPASVWCTAILIALYQVKIPCFAQSQNHIFTNKNKLLSVERHSWQWFAPQHKIATNKELYNTYSFNINKK